MRLFIALPLEEEWNQSIFQLTNPLRNSLQATWVAPHQYHITLQFLGEVETTMVKVIDQKLSEVCSMIENPVKCCFQSVTYFPDYNRPKALVLSLIKNPILEILSQLVQKKMTEIDLPRKSPFILHVTLARFKQPFRPTGALPVIPFVKMLEINRFAFIQSTLNSSGPIYTEIKSYSLVKGS